MAEDIFANILSELKKSNDAIAKSQKESNSTGSTKSGVPSKPGEDPLKKLLDSFTTPVIRQFRGLIDELRRGFNTIFKTLGSGLGQSAGRGIGRSLLGGAARVGGNFAADYAAVRLGMKGGHRPRSGSGGKTTDWLRNQIESNFPADPDEINKSLMDSRRYRASLERLNFDTIWSPKFHQFMRNKKGQKYDVTNTNSRKFMAKKFHLFNETMGNTIDGIGKKVSLREWAATKIVGANSSRYGGAFSKMSGTMGAAARGAAAEGGMSGLASLGLVAVGATAVVGSFAAIVAGSSALIESNRKLAGYNSQLSTSFANASVRQVYRNMALGQSAGGDLAKLNDSMQDLKDAWTPWEGALDRVWVDFANPMLKILTGILNNTDKELKVSKSELNPFNAPFRNYNSGVDGYDWRKKPQRPASYWQSHQKEAGFNQPGNIFPAGSLTN